MRLLDESMLDDTEGPQFHIFISANDGFTVYKSVPYGPLDEVLPYLSRRVAENRSVLAGARKERDLLASELSRRLLKGN